MRSAQIRSGNMLPRKQTCAAQLADVRFVPIADIWSHLFNHRIGTQDEMSGDGIVDGLSRFQIDREFKLAA